MIAAALVLAVAVAAFGFRYSSIFSLLLHVGLAMRECGYLIVRVRLMRRTQIRTV